MNQSYLCIDLKSYYASVECVDRGLDPFTANLVVADRARGMGALCLAVSPALKALGVRNRCRLFEIPSGIPYLIAPPRMQHYMDVSTEIYKIYLKFLAPEDIFPYSIDECFMDITPYLAMYAKTPTEMATSLMNQVYQRTGICATAGVGTNLFLAKIAMDILAKHVPSHIGVLDETAFRKSCGITVPSPTSGRSQAALRAVLPRSASTTYMASRASLRRRSIASLAKCRRTHRSCLGP